MRTLLFSLGLLCTSVTVPAQPGIMAIGGRATPDGAGATFKGFLFDRNLAVEAMLNVGGVFDLDGESFTAVGLLEYHIPLPDPAWRLFFGGGVHFGAWTNRAHRDDAAIFGIDGIGGVEYVFKNIPLGLSADFKPAVNFLADAEFFPHNIIGVAARYYLGSGRIRPAAPAAPARR